MPTTSSQRANARWKLLAVALKKSKQTTCSVENNIHSVRRFNGFNNRLVNIEKVNIEEDDTETWLNYTLKADTSLTPIKIKYIYVSSLTSYIHFIKLLVKIIIP